MGDDLVDWPAMRQAGLKLCPGDADDWIIQRVDYATRAGGGAVRRARPPNCCWPATACSTPGGSLSNESLSRCYSGSAVMTP